MADDVPSALQGLLPQRLIEMTGPFLLSGAGFGIFSYGLGESILALIDDIKSKKEFPSNKAYYSQIASNILKVGGNAAGLACSGFLLSTAIASLFTSIAVIPALVITVLPVIIPSALTFIAGIELFQAAYKFHSAKKEYNKLANDYQDSIENAFKQLTFLEEKIVEHEQALNETELHSSLQEYENTLTSIKKNQDLLDELTDKRFQAKREVGFATTDILISATILTLFTIGLLATLGVSSAVSLGTIPSFIIVGAAAIGATIKIFELVDDRVFDGRLSKKIDTFFEGLKDKVKFGLIALFRKKASPEIRALALDKTIDSTGKPTSTETSTLNTMVALQKQKALPKYKHNFDHADPLWTNNNTQAMEERIESGEDPEKVEQDFIKAHLSLAEQPTEEPVAPSSPGRSQPM